MRDSLRAVLNLQSKKIGPNSIQSFASSRMYVGAEALALSVVYLDDLYKETNDLFWKVTGYKVGQKLDPNNTEDAKMAPVWSSFFAQVKSSHINKDTNDIFWKQTNYKAGQKLDPKNTADQKQIPIWIDINKKVKAAYETLPKQPIQTTPKVAEPPVTVPIPAPIVSSAPAPAPISTNTKTEVVKQAAQAEVLQKQADTLKTEAVQNAKEAITAAASGDTAKAEAKTVASNIANAKSEAVQEKVDAKKDTIKEIIDIHSLSGLAYLAAKTWSSTSKHSRFFGWAIKEDGTVDTKWSDSPDEMYNWFGNLKDAGFVWGLYWDEQSKSPDGAYIPVEEHAPKITQEQANNALNNALSKAKSLEASLKNAPPTTPIAMQAKQASGAGIAVMVVLGGGLLMAVASGKKR